MPTIQSMGSGYFNYYNISCRYACETPSEAWYKKDLTKKEITSNNNVLNKDSEDASKYRLLEDRYASAAVSNRARYHSVEELRNALSEKYSANGAYGKYSADERNAMYLNELSMTCFGMIGCHSGMGGGDILVDPHLSGVVNKAVNTSSDSNKFILNAQIKNVFLNAGLDISLFGNNLFTFRIDPFTKHLTVSLTQEDKNAIIGEDILAQIEYALNANKNSSNLFYNLLYENNKQGTIPQDVMNKYRLMSEFYGATGLDIRTFSQTEKGFINEHGEDALDLYKKGLQTSSNVPTEFKGVAYDYFTQLVERNLNISISSIPDLVLCTSYKNGMLIDTLTQSSIASKGAYFDIKV